MKGNHRAFSRAERRLDERMTGLGRWSVGLTLAFALLLGMAFLPPFRPWAQYRLAGGIIFAGAAVCGLASGVTSAIALFRKHQRSGLLYITLMPAVFVLLIALAELTE